MAAPRTVTLDDLKSHNSVNDAWVAVQGQVFDVTSFLSEHPGGKKVLLKECGKDATKKFEMFHDDKVLAQYGDKLRIGYLPGHAPASASSNSSSSASSSDSGDVEPDRMPFAEPNWMTEFHSPYYTDSHRKWQKMVRAFVNKEIMPHVSEWEESYTMPPEIYEKAGKAGMLAGCVGKWPEQFIGPAPVENYDSFHTQILIDEVSRCGSGGVAWGFFTGLMIGLPPVLHFGNSYLKQKVVKDCLLGKKVICLCISEPSTASDVAAIETTAERQGNYYIVNGAKKWITNGIFADYFTVAVRTGPPGSGQKGLSFLLMEKDMPGLEVRHMKCQGVWSSGTTYITFDNVKVPARNLIGIENQGFKYVMHNFNHERWGIVVMANRLARVCLDDAFKYALKRKTFGQRLIDHQAIRFKISDMARKIEAVQAWTEQITYQWNTMSHDEAMSALGDKMALLKVQSTQTLEFCAREALHVFGGAAYVRSGVGERVERIYRDAQAFSIPAGAETIMTDYAARTMVKQAGRVQKSKL